MKNKLLMFLLVLFLMSCTTNNIVIKNNYYQENIPREIVDSTAKLKLNDFKYYEPPEQLPTPSTCKGETLIVPTMLLLPIEEYNKLDRPEERLDLILQHLVEVRKDYHDFREYVINYNERIK